MPILTDAGRAARGGTPWAEHPPEHPSRTWEQWCAWRRTGLALRALSGGSAPTLDLTGPATVIDLTGPEAVVSELRTPLRVRTTIRSVTGS